MAQGLSSNVSSLQWGEEGYEETPGKVAQELGMKAKHPIVIVPGWSTTGLELWQGEPCAQRFFRQRMWGTTLMFQSFVQNRWVTLDREPECLFHNVSPSLTSGNAGWNTSLWTSGRARILPESNCGLRRCAIVLTHQLYSRIFLGLKDCTVLWLEGVGGCRFLRSWLCIVGKDN